MCNCIVINKLNLRHSTCVSISTTMAFQWIQRRPKDYLNIFLYFFFFNRFSIRNHISKSLTKQYRCHHDTSCSFTCPMFSIFQFFFPKFSLRNGDDLFKLENYKEEHFSENENRKIRKENKYNQLLFKRKFLNLIPTKQKKNP